MLLAIAVFVDFVLPLYAVWLTWSARSDGRLIWLLKVVAALGVMGFLSFVARWDWFSTYLPWLWWALLAVVALWSLWAIRGCRWIEDKRRSLWGPALEPVVAVGLFGYALVGLFPPTTPVELAFPLRDGRFVIAQGGNSTMLNYHHPNDAQRFALDIVATDQYGRHAEGILPDDLGAYFIRGMTVVSPCTGTVTVRVDGIAENAIGATNTDAPAGNHIAIACGDIEVLLAHFMPGSIVVEQGDAVTVGQPLARVGNSGNSSEPHLHIHAVPAGTGIDEGPGVPLSFGGVFPVRNAVFVR